jgi:hypothetical protein
MHNTDYNPNLVFRFRRIHLTVWTRGSEGLNYESGGRLIADPGRIRIQILYLNIFVVIEKGMVADRLFIDFLKIN